MPSSGPLNSTRVVRRGLVTVRAVIPGKVGIELIMMFKILPGKYSCSKPFLHLFSAPTGLCYFSPVALAQGYGLPDFTPYFAWSAILSTLPGPVLGSSSAKTTDFGSL